MQKNLENIYVKNIHTQQASYRNKRKYKIKYKKNIQQKNTVEF